jgi:hypothetical protein
MNISEIRTQYPMYSDLSDQELVDGFHSKFYNDISKEDFYKSVGFSQEAKPAESSVLGDIGKSIIGGVGAAADFIAPANLAVPGLIEGARTLAPEALGGISGEQAAQNITQGNIPGTEFPYSELQPTKLLERFTGKGSIQNKQYQQANRPLHALTELADTVGTAATEATDSPLVGTAANMATAVGTLGLFAKGARKASDAVANRFPKGSDPILERGKELQAEQAAVKQPPVGQPKVQTELDLVNPNNKFGVDQSKLAVDENGMPINRDASMEAQLTERGGQDLFSPENVQKETISRNVANWEEPPNIELARKQAQIEAAFDLREQQRGVAAPQRLPDVDSTIPSQFGGARSNRATGNQRGSVDVSVIKDTVEALWKFMEKLPETPLALKIKAALANNEIDALPKLLKETREFSVGSYKEASALFQENRRFWVDPQGKFRQVEVEHNVQALKEHPREGKFAAEDALKEKVDSGFVRISGDSIDHNGKLNKAQIDAIEDYMANHPEKQELTSYNYKTGRYGRVENQFYSNKGSRYQRGSVGFGAPSFEKFSEKYSKAGFSPEVLARLYEETYSAKPSVKERVALSPTLSKQRDQANKTKFVNGKYFGDIIPNEEFIPAVKGIPDIDVGITKQKFVSSGRLQKELLDHPVTTQIYNITTKHVEEAGLASRRFLDDAGTGIIPILHHLNMTTFDGFKQAKEYFLNWRPKNEGLATELPPYFPDAIKRIHELEAKESAKLWKELEALRPENASKAKQLLNHMVHLWHGPYRFYLTKETANGHKKIVTYVAETSKGAAQKAAEYFRKEHPDLEQTPIEFTPQMSRQRSSMFDHLLDISKEGDPVIAEALAAIIKTKEASMEKYAGTHQRFEHRSGVGGFLGQKPWLSERQNYKDALSALREKYDAGYSWVALQKVKQEMRPLQDAITKGEVQTPKALTLGNKYIDHAFGRAAEQSNVTKAFDFAEGNSAGFGSIRRATKQVNQVLDKLTIPFLLAGKASNIVQNLVQPVVTIPRLIMLANEAGGKISSIPEAFAHGAVDGLFNFMDSITIGKSAELSDRIFQKSELTQKIRTAIDDMDISRMSMADDRPFFGEGGMATSIGNKAIDVGLNGVLTIFEGPTRSWAFSTYARKFAADGASPERAIKMAAEQMDTMTNYNKEAAAQIFSDMGMAGMEAKGLHSFMVNYYTQLGQYVGKAVDGFKTASPKEAVPLAMYMAQTFMFAGALGFIGIDLAEALVNLVQQGVRGTNADSKKIQEFTPRKWLLENAPDSLSAGPVAAGTGLGTYGFFTTKVVDPDRTLLENLFPKTTAKIQIASGVVQLPKVFSKDTSDVEKGNILEKATPRVFTPTIRRKFSEDGNVVLNRSQFKQGMPMYERTPEEAKTARKSLGLKATSEALNLEESIAGTKAEKRLNDSTNAQMQKLDTAFIQLANKKDAFSEAKVGKLFNSLINDWGVDGNELGSRLEKLAEEHAINDAVVRRIVGTKNISSVSAMDRFKRTVDLQERQAKRQGK